jgi:hypothetical protein
VRNVSNVNIDASIGNLTYVVSGWLGVVGMESGCEGRHRGAGRSGSTLDLSKTFVQNSLDRQTKCGRDRLVIHNLGQKILQLSEGLFIFDNRERSREAINSPRLSTLDSQAAAGHALGLARVQSASDTTNGDVGWKLVNSDQGSQSAIAAGGKELDTRRRHRERVKE